MLKVCYNTARSRLILTKQQPCCKMVMQLAEFSSELTERHWNMKKCFVYMVECRDGSLYTGWTTDVESRVAMHNSGNGAEYTRSRLPVTLVYFE